MVFAMVGLASLTFPTGPLVVDRGALLLMACAAVGWGIYSLVGRRVTDSLKATGWNFFYSLPLVLFVLLLWPDATEPSSKGIALAMISGGVTSATGYALWYSLLPTLGATKGALAQLSAPAIAMALAALFLGETYTWTAILVATMILGGIAVGLASGRNRSG